MKSAVTDLSYLKKVTGNDKAMMRFFIESYLKCAPRCMSDLEKHVANANWPELKKAAHTFRPQAVYMGLTEILPLLQHVEDCAAEEVRTETLADAVRRIVDAGTEAMPGLQHMLLSADAIPE